MSCMHITGARGGVSTGDAAVVAVRRADEYLYSGIASCS